MSKGLPSDKDFNNSMKELSKMFGSGFDNRGLAESHPKAVPTGHDDLDSVLTKGAFGIYLGGIIEIMGAEGSGKTSLALRTVGRAQKEGYRCCWFDAEAAFTEDVAVLNGCDPTELVLPELLNTKASEQNKSLSFFNSAQLLEMIYKTVSMGVFGIVVLDSVAGLMPQRTLEQDFDPNSVGVAELARNMAQILPKITQACKQTSTSVIFINQLRDQPGTMYGDPFHTPGGRALKFFASQRIGIRKIGGVKGRVNSIIDGKEELIGHYAKVTIAKNRKAPPVPPDVIIEIPIYYRHYDPDNAKKVYDLARKLQVITNRKGTLTWKHDDTTIFQIEGESSALNHIRDNELEPFLARACVEAEQSEKNQKKKNPTVVPVTLAELASAVELNDETIESLAAEEETSTEVGNDPLDL